MEYHFLGSWRRFFNINHIIKGLHNDDKLGLHEFFLGIIYSIVAIVPWIYKKHIAVKIDFIYSVNKHFSVWIPAWCSKIILMIKVFGYKRTIMGHKIRYFSQ